MSKRKYTKKPKEANPAPIINNSDNLMDVVYVLGKGSRWNDNELRYSLRSIEKHLKFRNVFIVGENPDWLQNIIHIPAKDENGYNKEKNIYDKIIAACVDERVSDDFVFFNDDHFLLKDVEQIGYYHRESLEEYCRGRRTEYKASAYNTAFHLKHRGYTTHNYDLHCPIVYNKEKFLMMDYDWRVRNGYVIKSLYGNTYSVGGEIMTDCKIQEPLGVDGLKERLKDRWVFSIGDGAVCKSLESFLNEFYPEKSRFEL